jgi:twitching motility protein PilT
MAWITDERFVAAGDQTNMVRFSERVAQEFGETMTLEFEGGRSHEAEVVRVTRMKGPDDKGPMLVACRFARALSPEETLAIGLKTNGAAKPAEAPATPPPPPPEAAPATERPSRQRDHVERRAYPRVDSVLYAEVQGDYGTYRAYALNVSASGALFTINDPQFSTPAEPDQLVLYTKRMAFHFRAGMIIRFLEADVKVEADVVRVSERIEGGELMIVIGAKFRRQLTEEECNRLEVELPAVVRIPAGDIQLERAETSSRNFSARTRILEYMRTAVELGASDLHIKVGSPARLRVAGDLLDLNQSIILPDEAHGMALDLMTPALSQKLTDETDVEFAYAIERVGRYRVCAFKQRGYTGLAIRTIPDHIPTFEELGLTPVAKQLAAKPRGLVLVTGPTGSGKSHTLAAMIDYINETRSCHILTMEDPIEFVHRDQRAHITQREIGRDCLEFSRALKRALRQDPDVILVGEMRDLETISLALTAAETGHLVFATLHTTSACTTPDRIIDVFSPQQQGQIRQQLADSLRGIMAQMSFGFSGGF